MSQTTGEEMLTRINATLGVLQDAQEKAVEAVRDVAEHKADPQAHGDAIAAAVEAAVNEALGGTPGGGSDESGEDGGQLADRLAALESRFDGSGKLQAANLPLTDAVNSATGTLAASDTAVKTAYDKASAAASAASAAQTAADSALERAEQAIASENLVEIGSRETTGTWTLTGLVVDKPLYIFFETRTASSATEYAQFDMLSGEKRSATSATVLGPASNYNRPAFDVLWPVGTTISLSVKTMKGKRLFAAQLR